MIYLVLFIVVDVVITLWVLSVLKRRKQRLQQGQFASVGSDTMSGDVRTQRREVRTANGGVTVTVTSSATHPDGSPLSASEQAFFDSIQQRAAHGESGTTFDPAEFTEMLHNRVSPQMAEAIKQKLNESGFGDLGNLVAEQLRRGDGVNAGPTAWAGAATKSSAAAEAEVAQTFAQPSSGTFTGNNDQPVFEHAEPQTQASRAHQPPVGSRDNPFGRAEQGSDPFASNGNPFGGNHSKSPFDQG